MLHWNGATWARVASPSPGGSNPGGSQLYDVSAHSPHDAWAVGYYWTRSAQNGLILRWNGTAWTRAASPNPSRRSNVLREVRALSPSNAWAVGSYETASGELKTLILHWDGTSWTRF